MYHTKKGAGVSLIISTMLVSLVTWLIYKRVGNTLRAMLAERGYKKPLEEKSL